MKILTAALLSLFSISSYSATFQQAERIYEKLEAANNVVGPLLIINKSMDVNADETFARIEINQGLLLFVHNDDELALVIGHEMGHYILRHTIPSIAHEYAADKEGALLMQNAGYNKCLGAQIFKRFDDDNYAHPANADRIKALGCS